MHESPDRRVPVPHLMCYGYELLRGAGLRHPGGLSQREPTEGKSSLAGGGDTARGFIYHRRPRCPERADTGFLHL